MMMRWWCLAAILGLALPLAAEDLLKKVRPEGAAHDAPADGKPWWDADTGFGLPQNLKGFKMQGWFEYGAKSLGVSVRLVNKEGQARADVYVYPCPVPHGTEDEARKAIKEEIEASVGNVYGMQKQGVYSEVEHEDAKASNILLFPEGSLPMIGAVVTMKIHEVTGDAGDPIVSWHGLTIFKGRFIKVRYTFPAGQGEEGGKLLNEFITAWKWCLSEPGMRAEAKSQVRIYLADPLSQEAEKAAAGLTIVYAEKSKFNSLTIGGRFNDILGGAAQASKGSELELLRGFIVGSLDSCLRNDIPNDPEAGAAELVEVYRLLQKRDPAYKIAVVDELAEAVKQKKAAAWLDVLGKK